MANYLYNGVELPDINTVWTDKETYPFAVITRTSGTDRIFCRFWINACVCNGDGNLVSSVGEKISEIRYKLSDNNEWVYYSTSEIDLVGASIVRWTNYDILNEDGSVYLAASEPIPVGGAEPIDPQTMLMGWLVSRRIAGQRNKHDPVSAESD